MVLLIDERPEEVTEMRKLIDMLKEQGAARGNNIQAEVLASTFDEEPGRHIKVASLVLEKAKRLVECLDLVLDRRIAEKRIWPAIDIFKSGTRKEELLLSDDELRRVWMLRRYLQDMTTVEIMEFMRDKLKLFKTNTDFLNSMNG